MAVGKAFERLKAGSAGRTGTRPAVVLLLLQARPLGRTGLQLLPALSRSMYSRTLRIRAAVLVPRQSLLPRIS